MGILEQLAPARSDFMTEALTDYFVRMHEDVIKIAIEQSTNTSKVITIDLFTGFNDTFLADDVHYNGIGAAFIAERYYQTLIEVLK